MDKEEIYSKIPKSTCKEGCFRCCTNVVQFTPSELKACGGEYECKGVCNFLKDGKCTVYETRPFVCRIYGTSEILSCDDYFVYRDPGYIRWDRVHPGEIGRTIIAREFLKAMGIDRSFI